jgi:hypothetical protein
MAAAYRTENDKGVVKIAPIDALEVKAGHRITLAPGDQDHDYEYRKNLTVFLSGDVFTIVIMMKSDSARYCQRYLFPTRTFVNSRARRNPLLVAISYPV